MLAEKMNKELVKCFCNEYQAVFVIDVKDKSFYSLHFNEEYCVQDLQKNTDGIKSYDDFRMWYIENYVVDPEKQRMVENTAHEAVLGGLSENNTYTVEYNRICGGKINYNQNSFFALYSDEGSIEKVVSGFRNIDVRKKAERDDLTGLYTRKVFLRRAEKLLKDNPDVQYDLMISDIVDFKGINEKYGSATGDAILKWYGDMLSPSICDDVLVGRYAGDQFVVMARHEFVQFITSPESAEMVTKVAEGNGLPEVVVKYGIYENVRRDRSVISTCDKAHMALNSIKHHYGKMAAYYNDRLKNEIDTNRKIENSMREALEKEQFRVYYQPKHDTATGKLVGAEALIRWIHPEYGFMSPADFIPLFEKNGFIVESDLYVWKRTCSNLKRWQDKGIRTVPVSVNASKLTFEQEALIDTLKSFENIITPDNLHIEITETMMTNDVDALVSKLSGIRNIGYKIELDDFGSGYSSINILSTLPLDVIKLDMSFMKQFGDPSRAKVLAACAALARDLGYKTVSEGVETREQCDKLRELGVDAIQGYYYSKPLPEEEFEQYLIDNS